MELHALARYSYPGSPLKSGEAPGVCSVGFWRTLGEQKHGLTPHRNEGIELTMSLSGETPVAVEGQTYTLRPGELMVTRPWQAHSVGHPLFAAGRVGWLILDVGVRHPHQEWRWPAWIVLSKEELAFLTRVMRQNEDPIRPVTDSLVEAFGQMVRIAARPEAAHRGSRIVVAVNALLLELFDLFESRPVRYSPALTDASRSVRIFLQELRSRLAEPWTVCAMAEACGLGTTHFSNQVQLITGESPARYLLGLRLERAAKRLREEPGATVAEIARQVGFPHANYFARVFTQRYRRAPAVWRAAGADSFQH
jgi:AraC family L-rhamnose operon regulatory protein RhaS